MGGCGPSTNLMGGASGRVHPPTGGGRYQVGRGRAGSFCIQQLRRWVKVPGVVEGRPAQKEAAAKVSVNSAVNKQKQSGQAARRGGYYGRGIIGGYKYMNNRKKGTTTTKDILRNKEVAAALPPYHPPSARSGQSLCRAGSLAIVFGGCGFPQSTEDLTGSNGREGRRGHTNSTSNSSTTSSYGRVKAQCLNDMHAINLETLRWAPVTPSTAVVPSVRTCHAMCACEDGRYLYLSGGASDDPDDLQADLYQFDIRKRVWTCLFQAPKDITVRAGEQEEEQLALGRSACSRIGHSMMYFSSTKRGGGGGGGGGGGSSASGGSGSATSGKPWSPPPEEAENYLVTFGGSTGYDYFNDVMLFNLATSEWTRMQTTGTVPSARYKQQAFVDGSMLYVMGGGAFEPRDGVMEVYALDLNTAEWSLLDVKSTGCEPPKERAAHSVAFDAATRTAYLWGGFTCDMELSQRCCALKLQGLEWVEVGVKEDEEDEGAVQAGAGVEEEGHDADGEGDEEEEPGYGSDDDGSRNGHHRRHHHRRVGDRRHHHHHHDGSDEDDDDDDASHHDDADSSDEEAHDGKDGGDKAARGRVRASSGRGGGGGGGSSSAAKARARAMALMQQDQDELGNILETSPPIRSFHASCFYNGSHYIFGGSNGMEKFNDVWRFTEMESVPSLSALASRILVTSFDKEELEAMMTSVDLPEELRYGVSHINLIADSIF